MRIDSRTPEQLRPIRIQTDFVDTPLGHALISWGKTLVLCTASVEERVPPWLRDSGRGWVTAEYEMMPGSTSPRKQREGRRRPGVSGRTQEIQRLIARSLRQATNLDRLGERQITVDCDVLQADGGTRTASITAGYVALRIALERLIDTKAVPPEVLSKPIAAVSVGVVDWQLLCDLNYHEDSRADVDANFVFKGDTGIVEVQGTGEKAPFDRDSFVSMLDMALQANDRLRTIQDKALRAALDDKTE